MSHHRKHCRREHIDAGIYNLPVASIRTLDSLSGEKTIDELREARLEEVRRENEQLRRRYDTSNGFSV